ncbi:type II toxin-antitoxin system RelE/ParE family toxin [Adlercreutzia caecimuris]|uniref:type II toxin-antitoxin system RelE/ParE family toxin n=1 Tax=Adlercreutzia caecimuris TaxID=671266 RepID=UPI00272B47B8|nr:type II toxin-antitoxin system RelE/ParE family toxin [Adlercreutzia caecimuris]
MVYNASMLEILQTDEFAKWLKRLRDADAKARINVRIRRVSLTGNFGDAKPVGDGVFELRIDYGPGYRVYYSQRGREIVLLLIGGDKSSQQKDIDKAKKLNAEYKG